MVAKKAKKPAKEPAKEPKKETKTETNKESDEEFLKRFARMREEASKKASEEISSYSKEIEEFRATGRQAAKDLEEIEECKKIVKEFEVSPPIIKSVHINGVSFEYSYEDSNVAKKIELLKKHGFSFLSATKGTSTSTVNFKTFGKAYVRRGMQKIPLPESSEPAIVSDSNFGMGGGRALNPKNFDFILKDGDILGTEKDGYVYDIKDVKENLDNWSNRIFIFPESELRISIHTDTTHPEPAFMDPSQVPDAIKRASSATVNTDEIMEVELIRGLFQIGFLRKGKDVNKLLKLPSGYPSVEFKPTSEMGIKILDETLEKARKYSPKVAEIIEAQYSKHKAEVRASSGGRCEDISTFIELNQDGSLVLFNTANVVAHKDIGKEAKKVLFSTANVNLRKDISEGGWPIKKITLTHDSLYEIDCSKNPDPRVAAAIKISMGLGGYVASLAEKKERENAPSKDIGKKMAEMDKKTYEEDLQMLKDAEEIGDEELIKMMKEKIKVDEMRYRTGASQKEAATIEEQRKKMLEYAEKNIELYKRQIESGLPSYNPPSESDKV